MLEGIYGSAECGSVLPDPVGLADCARCCHYAQAQDGAGQLAETCSVGTLSHGGRHEADGALLMSYAKGIVTLCIFWASCNSAFQGYHGIGVFSALGMCASRDISGIVKNRAAYHGDSIPVCWDVNPDKRCAVQRLFGWQRIGGADHAEVVVDFVGEEPTFEAGGGLSSMEDQGLIV